MKEKVLFVVMLAALVYISVHDTLFFNFVLSLCVLRIVFAIDNDGRKKK